MLGAFLTITLVIALETTPLEEKPQTADEKYFYDKGEKLQQDITITTLSSENVLHKAYIVEKDGKNWTVIRNIKIEFCKVDPKSQYC